MELTLAICTYRRFVDLEDCLQNITRQTARRDKFRVLVIDNSLLPDESEAFRQRIRFDFELDYVITEKNGISYARNQAIEHCKTRYLAYVDDDVLIAPDWVEVLLDSFEKHSGFVGCISGIIAPRFETAPPPWFDKSLHAPLALLHWGNNEKFLPPSEWFVTAAIGFDAHALKCTGGFDERLGRKERILLAHEDLQVTTSLRDRGFQLLYNPRLIAEHKIPSTRLSAEWFLRDAFWQTVSRIVYASARAFDLDGPMVDKLLASIERYTEDLKFAPKSAEDVHGAMQVMSDHARAEMSKLGYDPSRMWPPITNTTIICVVDARAPNSNLVETLTSLAREAGRFFLRIHLILDHEDTGTLHAAQDWQDRLRSDSGAPHLRCDGIALTHSSGGAPEATKIVTQLIDAQIVPDRIAVTIMRAGDILAAGGLATACRLVRSDPNAVFLSSFGYIGDNRQCNHSEPLAFLAQLSDKPQKSFRALTSGVIIGGRAWQRCEVTELDGGRVKPEWELKFSDSNSQFLDRPLVFQPRPANTASACSMNLPSDAFPVRLFDIGRSVSVGGSAYHCRTPNDSEAYPSMALLKGAGIRLGTDKSAPTALYPPTFKGGNQLVNLLRRLRATRLLHAYEARLVARSGLFFEGFYLEKNPDVKDLGVNPLQHYLLYGSKEGRSPNPYFDGNFYLDRNPDLRSSPFSSLFHFERYGWKERRDPHQAFSVSYYLSANPDVAAQGINPLTHFLRYGIREGRLPHPSKN